MPDDFSGPAGFTRVPVELRTYAESIVTNGSLESKLHPPPEDLTDDNPGPPRRMTSPTRDERLKILLHVDRAIDSIFSLCMFASQCRRHSR